MKATYSVSVRVWDSAKGCTRRVYARKLRSMRAADAAIKRIAALYGNDRVDASIQVVGTLE